MSRRFLPLLPILVFFLFAYPGLHAYFTGDDVMNLDHLHGYFTVPFSRVLHDVLNPFTDSYRPLGGLFYRSLFAIVGFTPLPFRIVCFALLISNLLIAWRLVRLLTESADVALIACLIFSYHGGMYGLYFNTGTIYDILCFTCVALAVTVYIQHRREGGGLSATAMIGLLALDVLAIQSKEMAWTLPAILILYEILWHRADIASLRCLVPGVATALLTLAPLFARVFSRSGLASSPFYDPHLSIDYCLQNYARYFGLVFTAPEAFSVAALLAVWAGMGLLALLLRSRPMGFGLIFWIVAGFPLSVIPPRDGFVLYLPMLGLALYFGTLGVRLCQLVCGPPRFVSQAALSALVLVFLAATHYRARLATEATIHFQADTRRLVSQLLLQHPRLSPGAQVLFVQDPFDDDWLLGFLFRLLYRDPRVWVNRAGTPTHVRPYAYVFRYANGKLDELPPRPSPCAPQPLASGVTDDSSPNLCWSGDWITEHFPPALGATLTYAGTAGARVVMQVRGNTFEYVCTKAFNRGLADMTIDGVSRGVLDLYSRVTEWQASFRFTNLGLGDHLVTLTVLGRHNPAATDALVDVDGFRVW